MDIVAVGVVFYVGMCKYHTRQMEIHSRQGEEEHPCWYRAVGTAAPAPNQLLIRVRQAWMQRQHDAWWRRCVCVCLGLRLEGVTVKHVIPIPSDPPQWHPLHTLGLVVLPLRTPRGAYKKGFQIVLISQFWVSTATAVGLFHNLGSFAPSDLQRTHFGQGVVNSLPSSTKDSLDHLGEGFSSFDTVLQEYQFHHMGYGARGWSRKLDTFCILGNR